MRNANGMGTVYKMSGARRKPWAAVVTKGFELVDGKAVQRRSAVGYYATKAEAQKALAKFNENPYDISTTFEKVFEGWKEQKDIADGSMRAYDKAFERFKPLYGKSFAKLKTADLERVIALTDATPRSKVMMKLLLNQMYQYAMKYDIVQVNYAERFSVEQPKTEIDRVPFSDEEIKALWDDPCEEAKVSLIMIYTGVRIGELLTMEYNTEDFTLRGGSKTEAGRNRIVPVREKIRHLMDYEKPSYNAFYQRVLYYLKKTNHTPHDCRVTFATRYKDADPTAIKLIMGHAITDVTKAVYTKYSVEDLHAVVESVDF